jgi:hypothetical protein
MLGSWRESGRRFDFANAATHIATPLATAVTLFAVADVDARDGPFAGATTSEAGARSLAVALRTQNSVWHCLLPSQQPRACYALKARPVSLM